MRYSTRYFHVLIQHISASLMITENADPDVRTDLETIIQRLSPDADSEFLNILEGPNDMSAHGLNILTQSEMTIPMGPWNMASLLE